MVPKPDLRRMGRSDAKDPNRAWQRGRLLPCAACRSNWHPSDIVLKNTAADRLWVSAGIGRLELASTAREHAHAKPPRE
jgi:hypothetical protein